MAPLRVVMVVANDVTRDSRVLREAATLADAGHRVTVLGIMTARTAAPATEVRDGFVIQRLPYRARPPGWWIPPDFYDRVRYRTDRQYRIHRGRVERAWRLARSRLRRLGYHADRWRRLHSARVRRWDPGALPTHVVSSTRQRHRLAASRLNGWRVGVASGWRGLRRKATARGARIARRTASVRRSTHTTVLRALKTPLTDWPAKGIGVADRGWRVIRPRRRLHVLPSAERGAAVRSAPHRRLRLPHAARRVARGAAGLTVLPARAVRAAARALHAWASILTWLAWGSFYLLLNRLSHGALEWHTGWRWRWLGWAHFVAEHAPEADVWHAHDMTSLPAVVELRHRRGGYAVYDSHEVYFESGRHADQPRWAKRPLERLERRLVGEVDAVITVNQSLAEILSERLGRSDIEVVYNCPPLPTPLPLASPLREQLGLGSHARLLLYHGSLAPHRGIEELLEAIRRPELSEVHLAFLGFGSLLDWLRTEAGEPRYCGRVHVVDAVEPSELPRWLAGVDVAVAPIQASTLNHRFSSPNKVFESIAVGTPVAGSDFPEFRRVIEDPRYGPLGVLFDSSSPKEIARAVRRILDAAPDERDALRRRCRRAAERRWNWEVESAALVRVYARFSPDLDTRVDAPVRVA